MNIQLSHQWLLEHVKTAATPAEIQRLLSLSGPSIERIEMVNDEPVYDIEITTNRMDSASVRGVAREAAVILKQNGVKAELVNIPMYSKITGNTTDNGKEFIVQITNDPKLCPRIMAVALEVTVGESPIWLQQRLAHSGIRSLNNLIDITNYVMLELGQPTHVFDLDRLGAKLIIRESRKGETFETLDHKTHTCLGGDIVADNGQGEIIDLIAIMGTANSVVTSSTKRVLFFMEHADPKRVRQTSMGLAIRTNAAQLNEKMLDPHNLDAAMARGIHLFQELAKGKVISPILDLFPKPERPSIIKLTPELGLRYLGISIPLKVQQEILQGLGCEVEAYKDHLKVTPPTSRPDLEIPVDLIEEIARIYGYHNLPSVLMDTPIPTTYPAQTDFTKENMAKQFLAALGWQEVYTYSAVSEKIAQQSGYAIQDHVTLQNPLNDDHVYMRRSLFPSHQEVIVQNKQRAALSLFELANTYTPQPKELPIEELHLTLTSTQDIRQVKSDVHALFAKLFIAQDDISYAQTKTSADIFVQKDCVGTLFYAEGLICVDLVWKSLLKVAKRNPTYVPLSPFSPIIEDLTFTVPAGEHVGNVVASIKSVSKDILRVELKDVYKQNYTFTLTYLNKKSQLTNQDIEPLRKKVVDHLAKKHAAMLVGTI